MTSSALAAGIGKFAAIATGVAIAGSVLFGQDAWAPEPAVLRATLGTTQGSSAAAYGQISHTPTSILRWTASLSPDGGKLAAGTPCTTISLQPVLQRHF